MTHCLSFLLTTQASMTSKAKHPSRQRWSRRDLCLRDQERGCFGKATDVGRGEQLVPVSDLRARLTVMMGIADSTLCRFGHRGYSAVAGGATDCPYTYMQDLVAGKYRQDGEEHVQVTDGTGCGLPQPTAEYKVN